MPAQKLKILVGTVSNTAYAVAQEIELACADGVPVVEVVLLDEHATLDLFEATPEVLHLVCSSTFGSGDVPDNAQALYADFDLSPRFLGGVRYGVIALGDSMFGETYARGGLSFDEKLQDLGATRLGEPLLLDASEVSDPERVAAQWARDWLEVAGQRAA
ncbi:MAG: flavodoxin domain-containing protein [Comamonas sp.]